MRNSVPACSSTGARLQCRATYTGLCLSLVSFYFLGCGGGEDFSKPPAQIQSQLGKAAAEPDLPQETPSDASDADTAVASAAASDADSVPADSVETSPVSASVPAESEPAALAESSVLSGTPQATAAAQSDLAPTGGNETITASGKTAESIAAKKTANNEKSVMGNAGGLLGSLQGSGAKPDAGLPAASGNPDGNPEGATSRFGRTAVSRLQWLRLVSQLARQFFVASTPDGRCLAGSTGERSLDVIQTQLDVRSPAVPGERSAQAMTAPIQIPVTGLPAIMNSLELTRDGQHVLIGTTDGRLLERNAAGTRDWDLFARDLFLFQDEHRRISRLSDKAIVAIRCLPDNRLLTIDADGTCACWNLAEAVLPVTPILEMTVEQAKAVEAETVRVSPAASFRISGFQILNITIADEQKLGAIVTSSEEVCVFRTDTGELLETLNAKQFADSQPVCVEFVADGTEILAGLADGRIIRRALSGAVAVTGIDDHGDQVDYELVFVPEVQEQVNSITSIRAIPGSRTICFGTIDGTVVRFDTVQKQIEQSKKRHAAPVIDLRVTPHGMLSIGGDRQVQLFDVPVTSLSLGQNSEVTLQLPRDETLEETVEDDSLPQSAAASQSTRPTQTRVSQKPADVDLTLVGIRPGDSTLALYGHQLRAATELTKQRELRKQILRHRGANSLAESVGEESADVPNGMPLRVGEATTQLQFSSGAWNRVRLAISDDGTTAAAQHRGPQERTEQQAIAGALSLFDMTTGTPLRHWSHAEPARSLQVDLVHHALVAAPTAARCWNSTGFADTDPLRPVSACILSADFRDLYAGRAGSIGVAQPALSRFNLSDRSEMSGLELFESAVTAIALSGSGERLYVGTRERDQVRLLEVDPRTLSLQKEIVREALPGRISADTKDVSSSTPSGTTLIQPSPSDRLMLTWGMYEGGSQLRLWRRNNSGWPQEEVSVIKAAEASPDSEAIDQPARFVNQQDTRVAIVTTSGLLILSTKKLEVEKAIPIPAVGDHRPPSVFSPDGKWLLAGDGDGTVWALSLTSLDRKPLRFSAQTGPIAGLAMSPNGRYLATIGEDNFLRSWRVDGFLKR